jgi:hypothetical protein
MDLRAIVVEFKSVYVVVYIYNWQNSTHPGQGMIFRTLSRYYGIFDNIQYS